MRKLLTVLVFLLGIGGVIYQNQGRIFLTLLSNPNLTALNTPPSSIDSSTLKPPYKDGTYTGSAADAIYGTIQVQTTVTHDKIASITFLQTPNNAIRSVAINTFADPDLAQEAIQVKSPNVATVTGATNTSEAFSQSLQFALEQAHI